MSAPAAPPSAAGEPPADGDVPDRQLAGMRHVDVPQIEVTAELTARRAAVTALGDALRELTVRAIGSEVDVEVLRRVTTDVHRLTADLADRQRRPDVPSSVDDLQRGQRLFNPVVGRGNPVAPPMRVQVTDGAAIGSCTLDWRFEGPFTFGHGGVSALLLDQIMGYATAAAGFPGVTGRLQVRYRSAVPLGEPLRLYASVVDVLGSRVAVKATIALAAAPDEALVEAEGRFMTLRKEQAVRLFGNAYRGAEPAGTGPESPAPAE
jgi:acyl-coenzyme A thioesterase PaaI-like protein